MTDHDTAREELRRRILAAGCDGAFGLDGCACELSDLAPCGATVDPCYLADCTPGYRHECIGDECARPCDDKGDWCVTESPDGPKRKEPEPDTLAERLRQTGIGACAEYARLKSGPVGGGWKDASAYERGFHVACNYADACIAALLDAVEEYRSLQVYKNFERKLLEAEAERDWLCRQLANFHLLPGVVQAHDLIGGIEGIWQAAAERHVREERP